jgi:hypothetical protein
MASRRSRPRRFLLPTVLAAVLAAEITGIALARTLSPSAPVDDRSPSVPTIAAAAPRDLAMRVGGDAGIADGSRDAVAAIARANRTRPVGGIDLPPAISPASPARAIATTGRPAGPASTAYRGTNHVWIPSLGITKGVQSFPCSRSRPPDAGVYRWGCAGRNNVYLLGHAWSTFKPLHDAYVGGRLRKGMKVIYADGAGHVHTYAVTWWRVVAPTTAASWAWASLAVPGMTLQTCVGSRSQYRLMVRLVRTA